MKVNRLLFLIVYSVQSFSLFLKHQWKGPETYEMIQNLFIDDHALEVFALTRFPVFDTFHKINFLCFYMGVPQNRALPRDQITVQYFQGLTQV